MTATPTCKPWCDELSECYTRVCIFDDGEETKPAPTPAHALFQPLKEISRIFLTVMEDEEDERPRVEIEFFETGNFTDADGVLHLDASGLKDLHAQLGALLKDFH
jgi:hypothetical protein